MPELSKEQREKIVQALTNKGVNQPCPRCKNQQFTLVDGYFNQPVQIELGGLVIGGPTIPSIVTVCTNCGFISQHALGVLGLLPEEGKKHE